MSQDKILIVGAGAIGSFYGALLAKAGADVSVVCRSDFNTVKKQGYFINSNTLGNWTFTPTQIIKTAAEYRHQADYIILCTKITEQTDRVRMIQDAVNPSTCIVFIQNGVEIEQELLDAFPNNEIISGLAFICCNRLKPGVIHHLAYGKLTLGSLNKFEHSSNKTQHLSNLINLAGIESIITEQIISSRWLKCLWNASFNPLSVLSDGLSTQDILSTQEALVRTIMQEVSTIAQACGHPLPEDSIVINIKNTYAMPPYKTSMLLDYENNQAMETEAILGNTVRAAKREKVFTPTLNTLYALMKLKELKIKQDS
ncbi:MAG: 2-dehydropantoate 2-reductase [Methylococcaceae bacterium]|nr:2-dehydropantoate 2-reductase [Methylococcaceae bacterium]